MSFLLTISFGLRNVHNYPGPRRDAPGDQARRSAGRVRVQPPDQRRAFRTVYSEYLMKALSAVARKASSNPESYVHLAESIQAWPDQHGLATQIDRSGSRSVEWCNLTGGIVALHRATR
jgi:demethylmenaquinone methyltransferase / 2-methoxy-6-polyprenyl-1,4-benzoquinol methylase